MLKGGGEATAAWEAPAGRVLQSSLLFLSLACGVSCRRDASSVWQAMAVRGEGKKRGRERGRRLDRKTGNDDARRNRCAERVEKAFDGADVMRPVAGPCKDRLCASGPLPVSTKSEASQSPMCCRCWRARKMERPMVRSFSSLFSWLPRTGHACVTNTADRCQRTGYAMGLRTSE